MKKSLLYFALTLLALVTYGCKDEEVIPEVHIPKVLSIIPKAGYPGTVATISGYYLEGNVSVSVGGTPAEIRSESIDRLEIVMPEKELGTYPVQVTVDGQTLEGLEFRYGEHPPVAELAVFSYSPSSGIEGDEITISGTCFSRKIDRNTVTIDDTPVTIKSATENRLVVVLPDKPEGQYPFVVTVDGKTVTGPLFTYDKKPELTVTGITPNSGSAGDVVTVSGVCFSANPAEDHVTINGVEAEVLTATTTRLEIVIPENPKGSYPVIVTVGDKTAEGPVFLYVDKVHTYVVKTISGSAGRAADAITLIDGAPDVAKYRQPRGLAFLPDGRMVIFDNGNNSLRFMDLSNYYITSSKATSAHLNAAWRGEVHGDWIYIASKGNNRIVRYNYKTDTAETLDASFSGTSPMDVCFDKDGNAYVLVRDGSKAIFKAKGDNFSTLEVFTTFEDGPLAMEFAPDGTLVVTTNGCQIIGVDQTGTQKVIAGIRGDKKDNLGEPGKPLTASFGSNLFGMTIDADGNIYVADDSFKIIKLIAKGENGYEDAVISTIAGTSGVSGKKDGTGTECQFGSPGEIRMHPDGKHIYVAEYNHYIIREITIK